MGNNVHLETIQELGEEQKNTSRSYLFSYTINSRFVESASGKLEAQLPPTEGQAQHKQQGKPTNQAIQTYTKNNLPENHFDGEIHIVKWKEGWINFKPTKIQKNKIRYWRGLLILAWLERGKATGFPLRNIKTLVTSITEQ